MMSNTSYAVDVPNIIPLSDIIHLRFEEFIGSFITEHSDNTAKGYRTDIVQFCNYIFNKEPKFVTITEFASLTSLEATMFYNFLKDKKKYKNATMKRKIEAVRSFMSALKVDYQEINVNIFDNLKLKSSKIDEEGYDSVEWDEAFLMIEYAHVEQMQGNQMAMLLKIASITSIRLGALLSLTWEDNFRVKNEKGILVNYIDAVDKSTRHQTPISEKFYNELRTMLGTSGKLFPDLYPHKVGKLLKKIVAFFKIDPNRNIKFHSFKKCGVNRVIDMTGDLTKAQIQGKHKSITTTNDAYIKRKDDLTKRPSYTIDQDVDVVSAVEAISHDELVKAVSQLSESSKFELLRLINKG